MRVYSIPASQPVVEIFQRNDNTLIIAAWLRSSREDEVTAKTGELKDSRTEAISVALPCTPTEPLRFYDSQGRRQKTQAHLHGQSLHDVRLRSRDIFVAEVNCDSGLTDPR